MRLRSNAWTDCSIVLPDRTYTETRNMRHIGLIGVGLMGHGIATNLLKHGHRLMLLEHPGNQPLDALISQGATTAPTPRALADQVDCIVLCVTGSPEVEAVLNASDGVLEGLRPGTVIIDCSTAVPSSTVKVAAQIAARGGLFLDAPMTRTPKEAAEGRLNLLVGGTPALYEQCRPLLACFAENITHVGPVGAGHQMKLLHNFVSLGSVALLAEAAACARRSGVEAQTFVDVLSAGGGWGAALERLKPYLLGDDASGLRFSLGNARKDLSYYDTMAQDVQAHHGVAQAVRQMLDNACEQGHAQAFVPELVGLLSRSSIRT